jgi:hypothetical protein
MSAQPDVSAPTQRRSEVRWLCLAAGRWVASRRGVTVGTIERIDGAYRALNGRGRPLGTFDDLDSARDVIDRRAERRSPTAGGVSIATALLWGAIGGVAMAAVVLVVVLVGVGG